VDLQGEQEWFKRLGSVKSSADLYVLVNDLLTKGVDWTEARQFFPICNTQYGDFFLFVLAQSWAGGSDVALSFLHEL